MEKYKLLFIISLIFSSFMLSSFLNAAPLDYWNLRVPEITGNRLRAGTYSNGIFVVVGDYDTILTSTDGENWAKTNSGTSYHLWWITYGNGIFVVVGQNGVILTSRKPGGDVRWPRCR